MAVLDVYRRCVAPQASSEHFHRQRWQRIPASVTVALQLPTSSFLGAASVRCSARSMQIKESAGDTMDMDRWNSVVLLPCSTAFESGVLLQVQPPLLGPLSLKDPGLPPVERTLLPGGSRAPSTVSVLPGTTRKGKVV